MNKSQKANLLNRFPQSIFYLAFVSFLMNISTSIVTATATTFVEQNLKNTGSFLVTIRCIAEGFSYFIKALVGVCSDITKRRKMFLIIGYGGVLIIKPLFILVALNIFSNYTNGIIYALGQILDRLLNATRDTPRDSLIADATPANMKAQSFGLRRFFASIGSQVGGLLSLIIMFFTCKYSVLYTVAAIPAFYCVYILYAKVQEPSQTSLEKKEDWFSWRDLWKNKLGLKKYVFLMLIVLVLSFGKFNEICLFQMARNLAYGPSLLIGLYMYFYSTVALSSYALSLSKSKDNILLILLSIFSLMITNFLMGYYKHMFTLLVAICFSGIYVGITESIICGAIVNIFPTKNMRATLFGTMNTILGISVCAAGYAIVKLNYYISLQSIYLYGTIPPLIALVLFGFFYRFVYLKKDD